MKQEAQRNDVVQEMEPIIRLDDIHTDRLLLGQNCLSRHADATPSHVWDQMVLESAKLCLFDVLSSRSGAPRETLLEKAVIRRWSRQHERFHSPEHFLQMRHLIVERLRDFLLRQEGNVPMILFETFVHFSSDLDLELKQTFHVVTKKVEAGGEIAVHKLIIDESREALELYARMTTVYSALAFDQLPSRIEAVSLLTGNRYEWRPNAAYLNESMDYLRVVKSLLTNGSRIVS